MASCPKCMSETRPVENAAPGERKWLCSNRLCIYALKEALDWEVMS